MARSAGGRSLSCGVAPVVRSEKAASRSLAKVSEISAREVVMIFRSAALSLRLMRRAVMKSMRASV